VETLIVERGGVTFSGASPGDYSLAGAQVVNLSLNFRQMPLRWVRVFFLSAFVLVDIIVVTTDKESHSRVSYPSHAFGALAGLLLGGLILRNKVLEWGERKLRIGCGVAFALYSTIVLVLKIVQWSCNGCVR